ncbi:AAC(3) family N-acetyltransferase [Brevibacillus fulvus]|uniref:Aminoglycoside N(3)-acetyltransferase n=1 Tax=Brevibacillus fulvus TaxID=1125967 RepID=A0A938Y3W6_9BACL|nr:AAC(3) family N-acetyltransferase [Brevibacillus fulvus]MBM7591486.1 aminoglycoside 3-N-acetyltransferase [Brevibacillus fulvus]
MDTSYVSYKEIVDQLPISSGDIVLVGSDITRLAVEAYRHQEKFDGNLLIDQLLERVGSAGTVLFPAYNWSFCSGQPFDIRQTPSQVGALSNLALKRPDFKRTRHPIYSFAVWGKHQAELVAMQNKSAFGEDSPFAFLHNHHGKMLIIGLDFQRSFTFVHYVEEQAAVDYRYMKEFTAPYVEENGVSELRTYAMFVRDIERGVRTTIAGMGDILDQTGISTVQSFNGVEFRVVDLAGAYQAIESDIRHNGAKNLYSIALS